MPLFVLKGQRPLNSGLSRLLAPDERRERWYIDDVVKLYTLDVR